ncbi:MAG: rane protein [Paenibacillaceae bacterium]|jgi:uncharacterized membrane-anchored protein YitT (DUF2179 family)|nr:rane protein [Paenibacillaceae bacterium]
MLPASDKKGEGQRNLLPVWRRVVYVGIGAFLAAFGLEMFLTPNKIIPGGVHGLSSLLSHVTEMQMGLILFFLNLPYVLYTSVSKERQRFFLTAFGFLLLTGITLILHPFPPLVEDPPLAALGGGVLLGVGVGMVLFYTGPLDGFRDAAILLRKRVPLTIDEIIMLINLSLLGLAGFIFGWDQALYSVVTYAIAMVATKRTINRLYRYKAVWIQTCRPEAVKQAISSTPGIDFYTPNFEGVQPNSLFFTVPKTQGDAVMQIIEKIDPEATMHMTPVNSAIE